MEKPDFGINIKYSIQRRREKVHISKRTLGKAMMFL
jgi:hypothetical protein